MALREKFGRLVLLEETETTPLGREYRAARLGPAGLDRLVSVLCFAPPISTHAAATKRLMDEARLAARLQNPGLVRVLGIGRVEQTFYVSTELVEGRTLTTRVAGIFSKRRQRKYMAIHIPYLLTHPYVWLVIRAKSNSFSNPDNKNPLIADADCGTFGYAGYPDKHIGTFTHRYIPAATFRYTCSPAFGYPGAATF